LLVAPDASGDSRNHNDCWLCSKMLQSSVALSVEMVAVEIEVTEALLPEVKDLLELK